MSFTQKWIMKDRINTIRKIVCLFLIVCLAISTLGITCLAEDNPTNRRSLVAFLELYTIRYKDLESFFDVDDSFFPSIHGYDSLIENPFGYLEFSSQAGIIAVDKDKYEVQSLDITLAGTDDDEKKQNASALNALIAVSTLEFNEVEERISSILGESVISKSVDIMGEITKKLSSAIIESKKSGSQVLVFSGNYDYYVRYYEDQGRIYTWLVAEAR